jgi:uncharacterized membrane protein HdeD (DUF308 family)
VEQDNQTLQGDGISATIVGQGAELVSLRNADGLELLWQAGPAWRRHSPIYPAISSAAVIVLLGWLLIISGVVQGVSLVSARHVPHFWLQLTSVILAALIGFLFLRDPAQGMATISLLLIVFFMMEGISKVVFALTIRPFPNWSWVLASGLVGILLALVLWANLPVTAVWLLGLLLGINLISIGSAIGYLAWQVRRN